MIDNAYQLMLLILVATICFVVVSACIGYMFTAYFKAKRNH